MVRRRKFTYVDGSGKKWKIDGVKLELSSGKDLTNLLEQYIDATLDDKVIKQKAIEISNYIQTSDAVDRLERMYHLGAMLQFIDTLSSNSPERLRGSIYMTEDRREALRRLFVDLRVDPDRKVSQKSKKHRYGERAYMLAKLPRKLVFRKGLTWSHWFDILEYPRIFQNCQVLEDLVRRCSEEGWASGKTGKLRDELQRINAELQSASS